MKTIVIIGGGPAGYSAALNLAEPGKEILLLEKNRLGGICVNSGCISTSFYLQAIKSKELLEEFQENKSRHTILNFSDIQKKLDQKIIQLRYEIEYMLKKKGIHILNGEGIIIGEKKVEVKGLRREINCDHIVIATGSKPIKIEGIDCSKEYSIDELLSFHNLPKELSIIGGGVLGIELAVILQRVGVKIELVEKESTILPVWEKEVSSAIEYYLREQGISVKKNSSIPSFEKVCFCCGRTPVYPEWRNIPSNILSLKWISIIGDCTGVNMRADVAMEEGRQVKNRLSGHLEEKNKSLSQYLFTPIEAGMVGLTTKEAKIQGIKFIEKYYSFLPRKMCTSIENKISFIKILLEKESQIVLGVSIVSSCATEIISIAQMIIQDQKKNIELENYLFAHPTESEMLWEAMIK